MDGFWGKIKNVTSVVVEKTKVAGTFVGEKSKAGWEKTKEVSAVVGEKSKPMWEKTKEGTKIGWEKTKEGTIYVAGKTKDGALYVGEKSKDLAVKGKETWEVKVQNKSPRDNSNTEM